MNIQKQFTIEQKQAEQENFQKIHGVSLVDGNSVSIEKLDVRQVSKEEREFEIEPQLKNAYERKLRAEEEIKFLESELDKLK